MFVFRFYSLEFSNSLSLFIFQVWECRRWPERRLTWISLFYFLEACKITSIASDLFIWCLFSDSTLWNSQILFPCSYLGVQEVTERRLTRELAYSTFAKQVRLLRLHLISLFDVCFLILLFGILKFSFLVHISGLGVQEVTREATASRWRSIRKRVSSEFLFC